MKQHKRTSTQSYDEADILHILKTLILLDKDDYRKFIEEHPWTSKLLGTRHDLAKQFHEMDRRRVRIRKIETEDEENQLRLKHGSGEILYYLIFTIPMKKSNLILLSFEKNPNGTYFPL